MPTSIARVAMLSIAILCALHSGVKGQGTPPETQPVLLQMIRDDAIHQELNLSDEQIRQVFSVIDQVDGPWYQAGRLPTQERIAKIKDLSGRLSHSLASTLDQNQMNRLDELQNQALGTRMIVRDETVEKLGLAPDAREDLYKVFQKTDEEARSIKAKLKEGELDASDAMAKFQKVQADERKRFSDALSNEQKRKLASLTGKTFDFGKVKRKFPKAPEIISEGSTWLQGTDLKLADLRGKVVALHFYAFGCINCKRNLPHYNAWHDEFADDGLVVIGIQSPETEAERNPAKVSAAMNKEGINYPVLFDGEMANWKNWAISWWPTVVLIDKQGFLRSHWEGEMNWKGTPGEQQMRRTIEQLLAE